jgi:chemotaxis protein methyltransferase CheR
MEKPVEMAVGVKDLFENIAFQKLKKLLHDAIGFECDGYRDEYLKRRFTVRLRATGTNTYASYVRYLKKNPEEYILLFNDLTVNYTAFFRDVDVYRYLEKIILPRLFRSKTVRIWSAGCATGEEPYSLAILVHRVLGQALPNYRVTIFASDLDETALATAIKNEYKRKQLKGLNDTLIGKYFSNEDGVYRVKDFVRQMVRFEQHDLMKPSLREDLDLIVCRNVMIYFSKESQQRIHMRFYDALRKGGYLVTGKSEILSSEIRKEFSCIDVKCRVYQKPPADINRISFCNIGVVKTDVRNLNNNIEDIVRSSSTKIKQIEKTAQSPKKQGELPLVIKQ